MIQTLSKQPLTARISVTDRCQLRCEYCMPAEGVPSCEHQEILSFEEITSFVEQLQGSFDFSKVRLTGGDPLARKGIVKLVAMLSDLGIPDLAMTTNAQLLGDVADDLRAAGLHRVNISLDSLNPETFKRITRGANIGKTLAGIESALQANLHPVKLNMVVMRGINDREVCDMLSFALDHGCELRFLELMPIGYGASLFESRFVPTTFVQRILAAQHELEPITRTHGSSARRFRIRRSDGSEGIVGFISPCSDRFCADCTRLRLTADGHLMGCLAREAATDIRAVLQSCDSASLVAAVRQALQSKHSDRQFEQPTSMVAIGG
ncbi:MAG: GTP 3',8-cyclase MoaA [Planctomycetes bacterium]|nr:GTP 3',8-cyclase MoaA [Planctomycetota bacterium]